MGDDTFYLKVARALSGCQLVEEELKLYISEAFDLVRKCVAGKMVFRMSGDNVAEASLGTLIKVFGGLTNNRQLVRELNRFRKERNFLSHQGITHCLDYEGELSLPSVAKYQSRLNAVKRDAEKLRMEIHLEANKFRGHLWFDEVGR